MKKNWFLTELEYRLTLLAKGLGRALPLSAAVGVSRFLGMLAFHVDRRHRTRAIQHLMHAGLCASAAEARQIALKSHQNTFLTALDMFRLDQGAELEEACGRLSLCAPPESLDRFLARDGAEPVILLTGHYGSWELLPRLYSYLTGRHLLTVMRPLDNGKLSELIVSYRNRGNFGVVQQKGAVRQFQAELEQGRSVSMLVDQHAGKSARGVMCQFFGQPAMTHSSAAYLHLETGVPILVALLRRKAKPLRYELVCHPTIEHKRTDDLQADIQVVAQRYTTALEDLIREVPEQWVWCHRRWKNINR